MNRVYIYQFSWWSLPTQSCVPVCSLLFVHSCVCSIILTDGNDEVLRGPWEFFYFLTLNHVWSMRLCWGSLTKEIVTFVSHWQAPVSSSLLVICAHNLHLDMILVWLWSHSGEPVPQLLVLALVFLKQPSDIVDEPSSIVWLLLWCDLELMLYHSQKHRFDSEINEIKHYCCLIWCLFFMSYWVEPLKGNYGLSVWTGNTDVCQEHPSKLRVYVLGPNGPFSFWWHLTLRRDTMLFSDSLCALFSNTLEIPPMAFFAQWKLSGTFSRT